MLLFNSRYTSSPSDSRQTELSWKIEEASLVTPLPTHPRHRCNRGQRSFEWGTRSKQKQAVERSEEILRLQVETSPGFGSQHEPMKFQLPSHLGGSTESTSGDMIAGSRPVASDSQQVLNAGHLRYQATRTCPGGMIDRDFSYYRNCALGGAAASSIRWVVTPLEVLKGYRQVNMIPPTVAGVTPGLAFVYRREGFQGLFKGLRPTAAAYAIQTSVKLSLYEYLRDRWSAYGRGSGGPSTATPSGWVCVTAAACAETCASVLMYPFERARVEAQTEAASIAPSKRGGFSLRGLVPLLGRQVPGTIVNLYTFESTVQFMYRNALTHPKDTYSPMTQLTVTLVSGYVAGMVCAVVSHPADSLLSLLVKHPDSSLRDIVSRVGWFQLMTRGLAPRVVTMGTIIGGQWYIYDSFKTIMGMGTTGG